MPVGEGVGQPLAEDPVPGEQGVRRGGRRLAQLGGDVVVAAGRGQHQPGVPLDGPGEGLVGGGVAGVQGEHHLRGRVEHGAEDAADDELRVDAEPGRDRGVVLAGLLADVHAGEPDGQAADRGEVPLRGEGEVGVAAAEVHDAQRVLGGGPAQVALVQGVGDGGVEQAQELLDLAVLRVPARLHLPGGVGEPQRDEDGVVLGQQPALVAVVVALDLELGRRGRWCAPAPRASW